MVVGTHFLSTMTDLSNKSVLVYDRGLFMSLALRLAEDFGEVLYFVPDDCPFSLPYAHCLGDGFDQIKRVDDFWPYADTDLIVFPDVGDRTLQKYLANQGKRIWGSRQGDQLELRRSWFRHKQLDWGLEVPEYDAIRGLDELRAFLKEHDGWFVKISRFRGLCETFQYWAGERGEVQLDQLALKLGPLQKDMPFLVEAPIDGIETGIDEFCIDGQWPKTVVQGIETKDKCYIGAVTPMDKMPEAFKEVNEALAPFFNEVEYRNFFSAELRITEDKKAYLTDPCCRHASPAGECLLELIANLGEILWHGADGELVEPKYTAKFAAQAIVDHPDDDQHWRVADWPETAVFKPLGCVGLADGQVGFPPFPWSSDAIGSVVGLGDTIEEAIGELKQHAALLEDAGLVVHVPDLVKTLEEIKAEEDAGLKFSSQPLPEPSVTIQP